jgi:hypothetical protein
MSTQIFLKTTGNQETSVGVGYLFLWNFGDNNKDWILTTSSKAQTPSHTLKIFRMSPDLQELANICTGLFPDEDTQL